MTKQKQTDGFRGATQREYGLHRGITQARVSQLVKGGMLQMCPNGGIDIIGSDARLSSAATAKPSKNVDYMRALTKKTELQARHSELDLEERLLELVPRSETWNFEITGFRQSQNRLMSVGARLTSQLIGESRPAVIRALIDTEIGAALRDLSDYFGQQPGWPSYFDSKVKEKLPPVPGCYSPEAILDTVALQLGLLPRQIMDAWKVMPVGYGGGAANWPGCVVVSHCEKLRSNLQEKLYQMRKVRGDFRTLEGKNGK